MKRVWAMAFVAGAVVVAGCGVPSYNERLRNTLEHKKYEQAIDTYLERPSEGKFKDLGVYFRAPKRLAESSPVWTLPAGLFDQAASFIGSPEPIKQVDETMGPTLPPLKIHVLVRQKPKKAAAKKGEPAPPVDPLTANRGDFVGEVRQIMASDYGPEANNEKKPAADSFGDASYKSLKFLAANGDNIRAYFARDDKTETEVAIIVDVPPALLNNPMVTKGVDYALRSFAVGAQALRLFNGGAPGAADSGKAPGGPAF